MAKIEGEILIGRPVEEVFDFVADPPPGEADVNGPHLPG
jgi:hypothetical protein